MSVAVLPHCPGCGVCTRPNVCPTDAISISGGKAVIGAGCIDCGLCIPVCPIGLIVQRESAPEPPPKRQPRAAKLVPITEGEEDANGNQTSSTGS